MEWIARGRDGKKEMGVDEENIEGLRWLRILEIS
jgi:hypothetical protein